MWEPGNNITAVLAPMEPVLVHEKRVTVVLLAGRCSKKESPTARSLCDLLYRGRMVNSM